MEKIIEVIKDIPLTGGILAAVVLFAYLIARTTVNLVHLYLEPIKEVDDLRHRVESLSSRFAEISELRLVEKEEKGRFLEKISLIESDLNNVARKSRNSDRLLLRHTASHCRQINHISGFLKDKYNYQAPEKEDMPDNIV